MKQGRPDWNALAVCDVANAVALIRAIEVDVAELVSAERRRCGVRRRRFILPDQKFDQAAQHLPEPQDQAHDVDVAHQVAVRGKETALLAGLCGVVKKCSSHGVLPVEVQ